MPPYFKASETFIPSTDMIENGSMNPEIHGTNGLIKECQEEMWELKTA